MKYFSLQPKFVRIGWRKRFGSLGEVFFTLFRFKIELKFLFVNPSR